MYEKTDKTTVVYYSKLQYTLQQTTIYTLEYQCKYFNITGTIIIGVNPSGGSDSATAHWQSGYSDSALCQREVSIINMYMSVSDACIHTCKYFILTYNNGYHITFPPDFD